MLKAIATQIEEGIKARFKISDGEAVFLHDLAVSEGDAAWQAWARYEVPRNGTGRELIEPGAVKIRIHKDPSHAVKVGPVLQFFQLA